MARTVVSGMNSSCLQREATTWPQPTVLLCSLIFSDFSKQVRKLVFTEDPLILLLILSIYSVNGY